MALFTTNQRADLNLSAEISILNPVSVKWLKVTFNSILKLEIKVETF